MARRVIISNGKKYIVTVPDMEGMDLGIGSAGGAGGSLEFRSVALQWLSVPASDSWNVYTGSFTVEWFQKAADVPVNDRIFTIGVWPTAELGVSIENFGGGIKIFPWMDGLGNVPAIAHSASVILPYTSSWHHFAIVRSSGSYFQILQDGVALRTFTSPSDVYINANISSALPLFIGGEGDNVANTMFSGSITSFRFVKGVALYSGSYTVPYMPLGTGTGTQLLLLAPTSESAVVDYSGLNKTVTQQAVSWSLTSPF